jgi:chromosome segregation ATPase
MQYKTIVLELLQQFPEMYDRLRETRTLLSTLEQRAEELKNSHEDWKQKLTEASPNYSEPQIASAAMEIALTELEASLLRDSPQDADEPPSLDGAMAFLLHSPPA